MKANKFIIAITLFIIGLISISHGDDVYQTENNLTDFDVKQASNNLQDLKTSIDNITNELFFLDDKEKAGTSGTISEQYRQIRAEIVDVINDINNSTTIISDALGKVAVYKKLIFLADKDLNLTRNNIDNTKEYIQMFSNFIYKLDNKLYDYNSNNIDEIKLLINSDNIPRTLANDNLVNSILLQLNDLMNNFNKNEDKQIQLIKKLNNLKIIAKNQVKDYEIQLEKFQQKKNYLLQFIGLYKDDKIEKETNIKNLFESTKGVYDKINELVIDIKKGIYKVDFNMDKKIAQLDKIPDDKEIYPVARPIYPIEKIQIYFGDMEYQKQYGMPHLGIQIESTQGNPVYSTRDGIVYFVADNDDIGINRTMIVHKDGYISTYQYLNRIIVKPGDIVRRGQLIGYSGGEPGTRGAGFISKGANLTFGLFKDGIAIDPFDILDASIVKEKSALPEGYQIKYLRDKYVRSIDITNLQLMTGDTLLQREDQFLTTFGVGIYKQVAFREDASKGTNIDKDVLICIAFAESTLGRFLSTENNIGNVGNNDRGDRIGFYSALVGARSIGITLNNQFLGEYHTIKQLSRYGNKDGNIYASSPINRQTNVLKCLSQIKGYYIPEDFPFRTGPNPNLGTGNIETLGTGDLIIVK